VIRSIPRFVSVTAAVIGAVLLVITLYSIDLEETVANVRHLGLALPLILLPGAAWHLLRTWGWAISFPDGSRPPLTRIFRVRLAADAISFFTVRGLAGEPLKVVLLYDRVPPEVTTAAIALERLAFAVINIAIAGLVSYLAVRQLAMPPAWDAAFTIMSIVAVLLLGGLALMARHRTGDYLGRFVGALDRRTGRRLEASRVIRFILDVEDVLLELLRGDPRRLVILTLLTIVCYFVMAFEVWIILWAVGEPTGLMQALTIDTFARVGSVASAAIPANIGALELANARPVDMLGLGGAGALALARRFRTLIWATLGLVLYPQPRANPKTRIMNPD
jgi:uncharacterized protein (TIRG00374 family)